MQTDTSRAVTGASRTPIEDTPVTLDPDQEARIRAFLIEHFSETYKARTEPYVSTLLSPENCFSRFLYLLSVLGSRLAPADASLLISGMSVGSEMIAARHFGFGSIHGVEVEQFYVDVCERRLQRYPDMHPAWYDGTRLPYEGQYFDVIMSAHIIEHTRDPAVYLTECLRVLAPGGWLFLEFPTRYHHTELHTGLLSVEWLPRGLRNASLRILSSRRSPLPTRFKSGYQSILDTNLQQISLGGVRRMLNRAGRVAYLADAVRAAPGIVRCVFSKVG